MDQQIEFTNLSSQAQSQYATMSYKITNNEHPQYALEGSSELFNSFILSLTEAERQIEIDEAHMQTDFKVKDFRCPINISGLEKIYSKTLLKNRQAGENKIKKNWTDEDTYLLLWVVTVFISRTNIDPEDFEDNQWEDIAKIIPQKAAENCKLRWLSLRKNTVSTAPWTPEEDVKLIEIINLKGAHSNKWNEIAKELYTSLGSSFRKGKQCRERWNNHLDPHMKRGLWTDEEDIELLEMCLKSGNKWSQIAKQLKERTENAVKNRFKSLLRRQEKSIKQSLTKHQKIRLLEEQSAQINSSESNNNDGENKQQEEKKIMSLIETLRIKSTLPSSEKELSAKQESNNKNQQPSEDSISEEAEIVHKSEMIIEDQPQFNQNSFVEDLLIEQKLTPCEKIKQQQQPQQYLDQNSELLTMIDSPLKDSSDFMRQNYDGTPTECLRSSYGSQQPSSVPKKRKYTKRKSPRENQTERRSSQLVETPTSISESLTQELISLIRPPPLIPISNHFHGATTSNCLNNDPFSPLFSSNSTTINAATQSQNYSFVSQNIFQHHFQPRKSSHLMSPIEQFPFQNSSSSQNKRGSIFSDMSDSSAGNEIQQEFPQTREKLQKINFNIGIINAANDTPKSVRAQIVDGFSPSSTLIQQLNSLVIQSCDGTPASSKSSSSKRKNTFAQSLNQFEQMQKQRKISEISHDENTPTMKVKKVIILEGNNDDQFDSAGVDHRRGIASPLNNHHNSSEGQVQMEESENISHAQNSDSAGVGTRKFSNSGSDSGSNVRPLLKYSGPKQSAFKQFSPTLVSRSNSFIGAATLAGLGYCGDFAGELQGTLQNQRLDSFSPVNSSPRNYKLNSSFGSELEKKKKNDGCMSGFIKYKRVHILPVGTERENTEQEEE